MTTTNTSMASQRFGAEPLGAALARGWQAIAIRGVLALGFSGIAFWAPGVTLLSLVLVFAAYALVDGAIAIAAAYRAARDRHPWGLLAVQGVISLMAAAGAVVLPGVTVTVFILLLGFWAIVSGALMIAAAVNIGAEHGRWWLGLAGMSSLLFGVLLFAAPLAGALVVTWWLGAYALIFGVSLLVLAYRLRALGKAASA